MGAQTKSDGSGDAQILSALERLIAKYSDRQETGSPDTDTQAPFDPFNNRFCRDMRNSLSESLTLALVHQAPQMFRRIGGLWRGVPMSPARQYYLEQRLVRYETVWRQIHEQGIADPLARTVVLWNADLFFECHEQLEAIWHEAAGHERIALQGLIQAAGVFVHLAAGHTQAARRMARKARERLGRHGHLLGPIQGLDGLVRQLGRVEAKPPKLTFSHP